MTIPPDQIGDDRIVVLQSAVEGDDPTEVVYSLIDVLNALYDELVSPDEVHPAAVGHYLLDLYIAQVDNGGHSQFLANTAGPEQVDMFDRIGSALAAAGHQEAEAIWAEFRRILTAIPDDELAAFLADDYLDVDGFHPLDQLEPLDDRFFPFSEELAAANGRALLARPELVVLDDDLVDDYVAARVSRIPDLTERRQAALDAAPSYVKAAMAYAEEHGLAFDRVTAGQPVDVDGQMLIEWYFLAGDGLFSLVELPDGTVRYESKPQ